MPTFNIQLSKTNSDGTIDKFDPITKASNVSVTPTNNIPESVSNVKDVVEALGSLAFNNGDDMVYLETDTSELPDPTNLSEIDDTQVSQVLTWSSSKISSVIGNSFTYEVLED